MPRHSYTACYIHYVWGTHEHFTFFDTKDIRKKVALYLRGYLSDLNIFVHALYVNPEHVHLLIEFPANRTIEEIVKLIKGASSHWINREDIIKPKFSWARGYGAFTVSRSALEKVAAYIRNQAAHHRKRTFKEEYERLLHRHGLADG